MKLPSFNGRTPTIGAWMIGDECRGMGIREDKDLVVTNQSQFVPHVFR